MQKQNWNNLPDVLLRCVLSFHLIRPKISGFGPLSFFRSCSIFRVVKTENPVSGHAGYKLEETAEIQCINNPEAKNSSALFQCRFFLENQSEFICNYWITDTREIIARLGKPCIAMWTKRIYICQEIVPDSWYMLKFWNWRPSAI